MMKGSTHSLATRAKLSDTKKGKHYSPKTEFRVGNQINLGRKHSEETRRKISKTWRRKGLAPWNKGTETPLETRRKIGESLRGRRPWNKGLKTPEGTKKKLSLASRGRHYSPKTEFKKGQFAGDKNPAKLVVVRKRISERKSGKPHFNQRGENHPSWKGGITPKNEGLRKELGYKLWRKAVFRRDDWTCQKCAVRGTILHAHHLNNFAGYATMRTLLENGTTLCKKCHVGFHRVYGTRDNTQEQLKEFLGTFSQTHKL